MKIHEASPRTNLDFLETFHHHLPSAQTCMLQINPLHYWYRALVFPPFVECFLVPNKFPSFLFLTFLAVFLTSKKEREKKADTSFPVRKSNSNCSILDLGLVCPLLFLCSAFSNDRISKKRSSLTVTVEHSWLIMTLHLKKDDLHYQIIVK